MKASHGIVPVFDDPNLVSAAGLVPVLALAQRAGPDDLLAGALSGPSPNPVAKARSVIARMLAGADSIDDRVALGLAELGLWDCARVWSLPRVA